MPLTCHLLPPSPSMNSKPHTCTAHSCGINSITTNRSRLIDQSSGEFFMFLFAQLFCRKFLYLTRHLPPLPLTMNYNPHPQGPSLRNQLNSQEKKQLHWPLKWWVIHFLLAQLFSRKFLPLTCHLPPLLPAMNYKPTSMDLPSHSINLTEQGWFCVEIDLCSCPWWDCLSLHYCWH